ncbi:MAG: AzlC family ABC transporter permease [Oscillospiraceae bacterium]|nr:AzlC family ABC transporter permease [Oscillospiraceae bacterium]
MRAVGLEREKAALKAAFPHTVPVLTGYLFLGIAYGILMSSKGVGVGWTFLMSAAVYAGSMQYVAATLFTAAFQPLQAFFLTLLVNARHLFYGISMLEKYRGTGWRKFYLIFGLTDETFSINCSAGPPAGVERKRFFFWVTLLDHFYWAGGSLLGAVAGSLLDFNIQGLDFVLTALFVVIFTGQWRQRGGRLPALAGLGCSVLCLAVFGGDRFLLPAMALILLALTLLRPALSREVEK